MPQYDGVDFAAAVLDRGRGHILARGRGLPREPRPGAALSAGRPERHRQPPYAVLKHRPGGTRMRRSQEREHVDIAVPEDVAAVTAAGQPARSDSRLAFIGDRCDQVKQREAYRELQLGVTVDADVGVLPPRCPRTAVIVQHGVEPEFSRFIDPS